MEYILGSVLAIAMSFGYTEIRVQQRKKECDAVATQVTDMEKAISGRLLGALMPVSKAVKELQEFTGIR